MRIHGALLTIAAAGLSLIANAFATVAVFAGTGSEQCAASTISGLLDRKTAGPIPLTCSVTLPKVSVVSRQVVLQGSGASGVTLDCNGGTIDASKGKRFKDKIAIAIRSRQMADGSWDAPQSVTIKNCTIKGFIRIYGLDINANGANMRASSMRPDHSSHAQASAPRRIELQNLTFVVSGAIPLYVGPGVTHTTLSKSTFKGDAAATAIYLDAESGWNTIRDNRFAVTTERRELIAVDGSSHNRIIGNRFDNPVNGGIFVYRNCGEGGVIRHQRPQYNLIAKNVFDYRNAGEIEKPAVWLGSRGGKQRYCFRDPKHLFGSSADPNDFARNNIVENNRIVGGEPGLIRNRDRSNVVRGNSFD